MVSIRSNIARVAMGALLASTASCVMYIPTMAIEDTPAYLAAVSSNWDAVHSQLEAQQASYSKDGQYGPYVVMTSVYGDKIPDEYDEKYMKSLMNKLEEVATYTWSDAELDSLASEYSKNHHLDEDSKSDDENAAMSRALPGTVGLMVGSALLGVLALGL
ncbi:hypothetical protein GGI07_001127 [Coemansia sp. Benny D115]|nr:hypothetical protein GGI07_001127 [Coemansia sp. Benny D115]